MYLRKVKDVITQITDMETGELMDVHTKTEKILVKNREEFIQLYTSIHAKLLKLTRVEEQLFFYSIFNCDRNNLMILNKHHKDTIAKNCQVSPRSISNAIPTLLELKLFVRIAEATYRLNPEYVWKDCSSNRKTVLKHFFEIECPECTSK